MSESYTPTTVQVLDAAVQTGFYSHAEVNRWHQAELRRAKAEALRYMGRQFEIASKQGTGVRDMIAAQFCYDHAAEFEQEDTNDHP